MVYKPRRRKNPRQRAPGQCTRFAHEYPCRNPAAEGSRLCAKHYEQNRLRWEKITADPVYKQKAREAELKRAYGLTQADYERILAGQGGCCALCGSDKPNSTRHHHAFFVDHDHTTGKVRALLCFRCNAMLGLAKDAPELLRRAAEYIESHRLLAVAS